MTNPEDYKDDHGVMKEGNLIQRRILRILLALAVIEGLRLVFVEKFFVFVAKFGRLVWGWVG